MLSCSFFVFSMLLYLLDNSLSNFKQERINFNEISNTRYRQQSIILVIRKKKIWSYETDFTHCASKKQGVILKYDSVTQGIFCISYVMYAWQFRAEILISILTLTVPGSYPCCMISRSIAIKKLVMSLEQFAGCKD